MPPESFFFVYPQVFLIPVEYLSPLGIEKGFAQTLKDQRGIEQGWIELFNQAFALAWERLQRLFAAAPAQWFAPRLQNICIATDSELTHPYLRPLSRSAWLLYAADFSPLSSSVEFGAYQFLHAERLNLTENIQPTLLQNLSYLLTLDDAQVDSFRKGCQRSTRPDADAFKALAKALPWIRELYHVPFKPPQIAIPLGELEGTGLLVPPAHQEKIFKLIQSFQSSAEGVVKSYYHRQSSSGGGKSSPAEELLEWLQEAAPQLLICAPNEILWEPEAPEDVEKLRQSLKGVASGPAEGVRADLELIDKYSRQFLAAVKDPESLPHPSAEIDQEGGTYLHAGHRLIAFSLMQQPAWVPLQERAPPYQRLLLGARTIHEWGHLADEAGLIGLRPGKEAALAQAQGQLEEAFGRTLAETPPALREWIAKELSTLGSRDERPAETLVARTVSRMPDWLANSIAVRFVEAEEMEAYIRVNVRTHMEEGLTPLLLLSRYVFEYQYLRLSHIIEDPFSYFLSLCGLREFLFATGIVSEANFAALIEAVESMCDCYAIVPDAFLDLPQD